MTAPQTAGGLMLEGLPTWVGTASPWGLIGVFVLLIYVNRLIPRRMHEEIVEIKNQENERLLAALDAQAEVAERQAEQLTKLADGQDVIVRLVRGGLTAAGGPDREDPA